MNRALVKPDPAKTTVCERPGCGDAEGLHLLCGCLGIHDGEPCQCPGFGVVYRCEFCRAPFATAWRRDAHQNFSRSADCRRTEADRATAAAHGFKQRADR